MPPGSNSDSFSSYERSKVCAKLITLKNDRKEAILICLNKPVIIGRNPDACSYVISHSSVSGVHCRLNAVRSPNGGIILSCQDLSKNGIILNEHRIRRTSVILMDGDSLRIPDSLTFTCIHIWKQPFRKLSVFDPTPPIEMTYKRIGEYMVTSQCLGSGSFATVHLALDINNHCQVACKSIRTRKEHEVSQVMKEVRILMALNHPNINRIFDSQEDSNFIHIFLQLCTGGDLFTYVTSYTERDSRICEAEAKYIMYQLLKALVYIHNKSIAHRDLKPENILLQGPGPYPRILLADFGLARPKSYQETLNVCGTVSYLPPEGILALDQKHLGYRGMPADCWSAGVILYIMLAGCHPFDSPEALRTSNAWFTHIRSSHTLGEQSQFSQSYVQNESKLKERIIYGEVDFQRSPWDSLPHARSLASRLLVHNPEYRATVSDAISSTWITMELDDLERAYCTRIIAHLDSLETIAL